MQLNTIRVKPENHPLYPLEFLTSSSVDYEYICDERNNPSDVVDSSRIVSSLYIFSKINNDYWIIDLSDYLTWILNNINNYTRSQVLEYGEKICVPLIIKEIKDNRLKLKLEWDLSFTRVCLEYFRHTSLWLEIKENLCLDTSLLKQDSVEISTETIVIQTKEQFLKNNNIIL